MTTVSRSDIYVRGENGPDWFNEFLESFAKSGATGPTSIQEILDAINNKRGETVESVVQSYREQVGLDVLGSEEEDESATVKNASSKFRPLSIRHASIVEKIKKDPKLLAAIDSHYSHSGGTKNIHALLSFLRNLIGQDVSFSDKELKDFLEKRRENFKIYLSDEASEDVGRVGTDPHEHHEDDLADFMRYDGAK